MSNKKYTEEDFDKEDYKRVVDIYREVFKKRTGEDLTMEEIWELLSKRENKQ